MVNPFMSKRALENSNYTKFEDGKLVRLDGEEVTRLTAYVHDQFRGLVQSEGFVCPGAKAAVSGGTYRFALYAKLGAKGSVHGMARDLCEFVGEGFIERKFATFVACFIDPHPTTETQFETRLWRQLQGLHDLDAEQFPYDATVSADPADRRFSFSFAGHKFFVAGLHSGAAMPARRFAWPTLVFNPGAQFDRMRDKKQFQPFKATVHDNQIDLQGYANPLANDHGRTSEAVQYAGVVHPVSPARPWRCPFRPRKRSADQS